MGEEEAFFFLSVLFLVSHKPPVPLQSALSRHHSLTSASWRMFSNWIVKARTKPNVLNSISIQNQIWIGVNLLPSFIFLLPMPSTAVPYTSANKVCLHTQCLCWLTSWFGRGFEKALTNRCQLTRLQCQGLVLFIATSLIPLAPFPRVPPLSIRRAPKMGYCWRPMWRWKHTLLKRRHSDSCWLKFVWSH